VLVRPFVETWRLDWSSGRQFVLYAPFPGVSSR
jgi:hypothetical protein